MTLFPPTHSADKCYPQKNTFHHGASNTFRKHLNKTNFKTFNYISFNNTQLYETGTNYRFISSRCV